MLPKNIVVAIMGQDDVTRGKMTFLYVILPPKGGAR